MGDVPTPDEAVNFFNKLGIDGSALQAMLINQHNNCGDNRDFVHECVMYAVYSNNGIEKALACEFENVDALIGFKGDIYSGSMGNDDIKSDVAAVNIYYRMLNLKDGNIFGAMIDYNNGVNDGTINEAKEFLRHYGNGSWIKGMKRITREITDISAGSLYLTYKGDYKKVIDSAIRFYEYLISGLMN